MKIPFEVQTEASAALAGTLATFFGVSRMPLDETIRACVACAVYACKRSGLSVDIIKQIAEELDKTPLPPEGGEPS